MNKVKIFDQAFRRWENKSLNLPFVDCPFCELGCYNCPLDEYGYACYEDDDPWREYIYADDRKEAARNMHMLIHLIALSEGVETVY